MKGAATERSSSPSVVGCQRLSSHLGRTANEIAVSESADFCFYRVPEIWTTMALLQDGQ
ncbi:hypothetical protein BD779DRAFT_1490675 [Infundibulicybe gibba]|nr:hypothetical protein BD779DRAFT_1490675 [Infundibulicybe gibba]